MENFGSLGYELLAIPPVSKKRIYVLKREVGLDILLTQKREVCISGCWDLVFFPRNGEEELEKKWTTFFPNIQSKSTTKHTWY